MNFILKILTRLKLIKFFNLVSYKDGIKIPIIGGLGYVNILGTEKWMKEVIRILLPVADGCFVDVGVNIGQTLIKLKQINRDIKYIGFEPNPHCVYYVDELIRINKFTSCEVIAVGISSMSNIIALNFFSNSSTDPAASIIPNFRQDEKFAKILLLRTMIL